MSSKETNRISILEQLKRKEIKQKTAAKLLGLSIRQTRRLTKRYRQLGTQGLVHGNRGKASNHKMSNQDKNTVIDLVKKYYRDFGPTLASEKLWERHQIKVSVEKLRQLMIEADLWQPKARKWFRVYHLRERRSQEGELVQLDGSPHAWFEDRGPYSTLLVYVDDATSKIMWLRFAESESILSYFTATNDYLLLHGKPACFYSDKHGVFRINSTKGGGAATSDNLGETQFGRAMRQLSINTIFANTPQAKGRVEKIIETLQDRLVKELRLKQINTIKAANRYIPEYIQTFNRKFGVAAKNTINAHRPLTTTDKLDRILAIQVKRTLSKNLTFQYQNQLFQVQIKKAAYTMRRAPVTVIEQLDGTMVVEYQGRRLDYRHVTSYPKAITVDSKTINAVCEKLTYQPGLPLTAAIKPGWRPAANHPWKRAFITN